MNKSSFKSSGSAEGPDKVDMSLDDIIRLNKKQIQGQKAALRRQRLGVKGRLAPGRRAGAPLHRGGGVNKLFRRRGQGVITGLAAKKAALLKGVSPLNRPALNRANTNKHSANRAPAKRPTLFQVPQSVHTPAGFQVPQSVHTPARFQVPQSVHTPARFQVPQSVHTPAGFQRTRPFVPQRRHTPTQMQRRPYTQTDARKAPGRVSNRPFRLRRKWNAPPVNETQREARQATFLSRRGLKVRAHVQKTAPIQAAQRTQRTRPWRTPLNSSGILTVSIDNPGARTQPEPAHSWSLHPTTVTPPPQNTVPEPERKKPKGVALQFDINSVGKQTAMTLNERFRILKMKRMAAVQQNARGGRFVTVG